MARAQAVAGHRAHVWHVKHLAHVAAEKYRARHAAAAVRARSRAVAYAGGHRKAAAPVTLTQSYSGSPQAIARQMLAADGMADQFSCLNELWIRESGWNVYAENPSSGAYGIPQANPASKLATAGSNWRSSAHVQIAWGLEYLYDTYGSPCGGWAHEQADGWY